MSDDTKQFFQFIAALLIMAWLGGQVAGAGLPREYAFPFLILWILAFLAVVGFIIAGKEGMIELLRAVGLFWGAVICAAIPVIFLSILLTY